MIGFLLPQSGQIWLKVILSCEGHTLNKTCAWLSQKMLDLLHHSTLKVPQALSDRFSPAMQVVFVVKASWDQAINLIIPTCVNAWWPLGKPGRAAHVINAFNSSLWWWWCFFFFVFFFQVASVADINENSLSLFCQLEPKLGKLFSLNFLYFNFVNFATVKTLSFEYLTNWSYRPLEQPSWLRLYNTLTASLNMTLNSLMVRLQLCWSFGEYGVPFHCHYSQAHFSLEW